MSKVRNRFTASWDALLVSLTSLIVIILLTLNYFNPGMFPTILTWSIIFGCAAFGVYGYSIQGGKLKILRLGWSKDIQVSDIKRIEHKPLAMTGSIRTWGIGGLFGYIGYFKNSIIGSYKAYATHRKRTVVITTKDDQIVISPDNPKEFVQALKVAETESDISAVSGLKV